MNWLSARYTHALIAVSKDASSFAIEAEHFPTGRVHVIPNGVEVEQYGRASGPITAAVAVGRLVPVKGFDVLLHALTRVVAVDPTFVLTLVGDGPEKGRLSELAGTLGMTANLRMLGHRTDVADLLPRFGMFILSSRSEGVPLTLLEAMAAGLPVVATAVGGVPEVVSHGKDALLVAAEAPDALADAILSLVSNPGRATMLGRAARETAMEKFTMTVMASRYERLYTE